MGAALSARKSGDGGRAARVGGVCVVDIKDVDAREAGILIVLAVATLLFGILPSLIFDLSQGTTQNVLDIMNLKLTAQ